MQTRKKVDGKNAPELGSPRISRHQKKLSENSQNQSKRVSDLITSSARKQKSGNTFSKKDENSATGTELDSRFRLVDNDAADICWGQDVGYETNYASVENKGYEDGTANCQTDAIFSPAFRTTRSIAGEISTNVELIKPFQHGDQPLDDRGKENMGADILNGHVQEISSNLGSKNPTPEVFSTYHTLRNSRLECVDEFNQDQVQTDISMEETESEEFDDFDPYFFIKNLPDLSAVVPTFRPLLLPKQTRSCPSTTLALDLDETLVHSTLEPCDDADFTFSVNFNLKDHTVYVRCRPHLKYFLERVSSLFEIIIFTASQSIYAERVLNVLDPKRKLFRHRVYRDSCVFVDGNYLKDLSILGRDLAHVIIVDNSPQAFGFQVDNGIPIESWFDDPCDQELLVLLPFLEGLVGVEDVRPIIAEKFNLKGRINAAISPYSSVNGNSFDR
ncbi:PREDICTED: CTD small phosphatase-like protein 2 [Ipomoea nil]|uniref:CTD small phosphatase-like protein 2 n=1 Tax=Ipomoea nil TaxID=35883 RepID=UPI0009019842|nr:PREDICTED: CTD small phosphatase-like protein 2 [Ipomoea nil]XP_019176405.1 PREDICTED: CTD small phosphatase-like protein 2 [Ipomoea nil]